MGPQGPLLNGTLGRRPRRNSLATEKLYYLFRIFNFLKYVLIVPPNYKGFMILIVHPNYKGFMILIVPPNYKGFMILIVPPNYKGCLIHLFGVKRGALGRLRNL